jgi:hypothetical protein
LHKENLFQETYEYTDISWDPAVYSFSGWL